MTLETSHIRHGSFYLALRDGQAWGSQLLCDEDTHIALWEGKVMENQMPLLDD